MQVFSTSMSKFREKSAGYLANHMARLFASGLQRRIQPLGLAPAQFMVLLELWEQDDLTQRDLVARVELHPVVVFADGVEVSREQLEELHHKAHAECFIANSVKDRKSVV